MAREYTDEDMQNMSSSIYLSIREGESVKCVTLSGINIFERGDRDMAGRVFDGGRFNKETEEQMQIFDLNSNREKILNVPLYLRIAMFNLLRDNDLKLSDLKSGKLLLEICRHASKEWDVKLVDRNYRMGAAAGTDTAKMSAIETNTIGTQSETKGDNKEDLKFDIFKIISKNDEGTTIEEISDSLGGNIDSEILERLLEDLTFKERKIRKFEKNEKEYYTKR
jgi:hypothetical protein